MSTFDIASILFLVAALAGLANERLFGLPRGIALLIASLVLSLLMAALGHVAPVSWLASASEHRLLRADLPRVLLDGVLALLLFAATWHVDLAGLRRQAGLITIFATLGVLLASAAFAFGFWLTTLAFGASIPLVWCFLLGTILAPTDAVAVDSLLRRVALPAGLRDIIAGESLFNDGTAVLVFLAALALIAGQSGVIGHGHLAIALAVDCAGGALIGIATGWLARLAMAHSRDEIVSLTISIALALSTYRLAVLTDVSGPIAVVVAGLVLINGPPGGKQPAAWRKHLAGFWSMIDDLVNTLLFLLMGAEILTLDLTAFTRPAVLAAIPLAILARLISIGIPLAIWPMPQGEKSRMTIALTWVGLRGAVSIALVLTAPEGPYTSTLAAACYTVVIFTIIAQGLSTPLVLGLLYRSGIVPRRDAETARPSARAASASLERE